jgi:alpha-amylase
MKWLSDYITEFGIDGYRVDTVKHTTEDVWTDFAAVCKDAFKTYKTNNPTKVLDDNDFFLIGEVYGYGIHGGRMYDFGDKKVDYFAHGFDNLINFDFKGDAHAGYADLFEKYNTAIHTVLKGKSIMNYGSSHDDGHPFDKERTKAYEMGTKLLLTPGISQIYYGDEVGRSLIIEGTVGDATLRSMMPWETIATDPEKQALLKHYQKLGQFRANHPSVGAGIHQKIAADFFVCSRTFEKENFKDAIVMALDTNLGKKSIPVGAIFEEGISVRDAYSGQMGVVKNGSVWLDTAFTLVLLERL